MTIDFIFPQPGDIASLSLPALLPASAVTTEPIREISQLAWIGRRAALGSENTVVGLLWLAMNFPTVYDAMLDKTEFDAGDDEDPGQEPEPYCAECGVLTSASSCATAATGSTTTGQIEVFDPGHDPVLAWRLSGIPA